MLLQVRHPYFHLPKKQNKNNHPGFRHLWAVHRDIGEAASRWKHFFGSQPRHRRGISDSFCCFLLKAPSWCWKGLEKRFFLNLKSSPSPEFFYKLSKEILHFLQCHIFSSNLLAHSVDCAPPNDKTWGKGRAAGDEQLRLRLLPQGGRLPLHRCQLQIPPWLWNKHGDNQQDPKISQNQPKSCWKYFINLR